MIPSNMGGKWSFICRLRSQVQPGHWRFVCSSCWGTQATRKERGGVNREHGRAGWSKSEKGRMKEIGRNLMGGALRWSDGHRKAFITLNCSLLLIFWLAEVGKIIHMSLICIIYTDHISLSGLLWHGIPNALLSLAQSMYSCGILKSGITTSWILESHTFPANWGHGQCSL